MESKIGKVRLFIVFEMKLESNFFLSILMHLLLIFLK